MTVAVKCRQLPDHGHRKSAPNWHSGRATEPILADVHSALQVFSRRRRHVARGLRKTMTSDRGKEMGLMRR
ncbi:MAG: hypothetical protein QF569_20805 [Candidatus Poribacteria bacterium]|nr:hypothetical protein [Candidatus Poribacteria bacterium]